jgi:hypothetical protein
LTTDDPLNQVQNKKKKTDQKNRSSKASERNSSEIKGKNSSHYTCCCCCWLFTKSRSTNSWALLVAQTAKPKTENRSRFLNKANINNN